MFCTACGAEGRPGARFCADCGVPVAVAAAPIANAVDVVLSPPAPTEAAHAKEDEAAWPWARFLARQIDLILISVVLVWGLFLAAPEFLVWLAQKANGNDYVLGFFLLPAVMVLDAVVLALLGTTPGKWLARVRVRKDGKRISLMQALARNLGVYFSGLAMGFPLVNLVSVALSARRLRLGRKTIWDEAGGFTASGDRLGVLHWVALVMLWLSLFAMSVVSGQLMSAAARGRATHESSQSISAATPSSKPTASAAQASWSNPVTGRTILIPDGWKVSPSGVDGLFMFMDRAERNVIMFGSERLDFDPPKGKPDELLKRYMAALQEANGGKWGKGSVAGFSVDPPTTLGEFFPSADLNGVPAEIDAYVWRGDGRVIWRLLILRERGAKRPPWVTHFADTIKATSSAR